MTDAAKGTPDHDATLPRARWARLSAGLSLGVGVFATMVAWGGVASVLPGSPHLIRARYRLTVVEGDVGVLLAAATAGALTWLVARAATSRRAAATAWLGSLALGGAVGATVVNFPRESVGVGAWGVGLWLVLATVRGLCAAPLAVALRRGALLATRDAIDRVQLGAALWLFAALVESALVVRIARPTYAELAGPALGVSLFALVTLTGLSSLAALARSARWLALWVRVGRGDGWRVVDAASWTGEAPAEAWFDGLGPSDGVALRTVAREGQNYRESDVAVALGRVPTDVARVTRGLRLRAFAAAALLAAVAVVTVTLVAPLRW